MVAYNDMEPTEKIKVYDTGFKVRSDEEKQLFNADYGLGIFMCLKYQLKPYYLWQKIL